MKFFRPHDADFVKADLKRFLFYLICIFFLVQRDKYKSKDERSKKPNFCKKL